MLGKDAWLLEKESIINSLESIYIDMKDSLQHGGLIPARAKTVREDIERITKGIPNKISPIASLEAFEYKPSQMHVTQVSANSLRDYIDSLKSLSQ